MIVAVFFMSTDRILSEAEMSDVHGGFSENSLATSYENIFVKYVEDIRKNLSDTKSNYLMNQGFWSGFHHKP